VLPPAVPVMFVSSHAQLGGGEGYMRSIIEGLGEDWLAEIVSLQDGPFVERLRDGGHAVTVLESPRGAAGFLGAARSLRRRIRASGAEVIHANGIKAALIAAMANPLGRPPIIWLKFDTAWDNWLARVVGLRCVQIVGISHAVNEFFGRFLARRARVVYAGIPDYPDDRRRGREIVEASLGGPPAGPVIALSGRLCPGKGQLDLVDAAPAILAAHPDAKLLFLGVEDVFYPGFQARLEQRAGELGVSDAVAFADLPGHSPAEAVAVVSASDVLAAPSQEQENGGWREGFGLAVVEAMYVGTPVAAYASGALPEVIDDCGLVVPERDHVALGRAINRLLGDAELREQLIERGRRRARERFSLRRVVEEMAGCYREAAGRVP
jgi:glycosyltransferase involved in cell wall biosynthesis